MSVTTTAAPKESVKQKVESFFSKLKAEIKVLFGEAVKDEPIAAQALAVAAPLVETIMEFTPLAADEPLFASLVAKIQTGMATATLTLQGAGGTPTIASTLGSINTNLGALEGAAQIKDPATAAKLTAAIGIISGEITAILGALPGPISAPTPAAAPVTE